MDDMAYVLTSAFHFIIWVHFTHTDKGLNIPPQLSPEISSPRGFIIIIIIIIIIINIIIIIRFKPRSFKRD